MSVPTLDISDVVFYAVIDVPDNGDRVALFHSYR